MLDSVKIYKNLSVLCRSMSIHPGDITMVAASNQLECQLADMLIRYIVIQVKKNKIVQLVV